MKTITDSKAECITRIADAFANLTEEQAEKIWYMLEGVKLLSEAEKKESA